MIGKRLALNQRHVPASQIGEKSFRVTYATESKEWSGTNLA